jgi:hypothetical protein
MKRHFLVLWAALVVGASVAAAQQTQDSPLPPPSPVEKELAAKAVDVTEVTLGRNMLAFASNFMKGKDADEAAAKKLIQGLQGIYVREYTFDKEGAYSPEQIEQLRKYFTGAEWVPMVHERELKHHSSTDVMMKMVNGESHGLFVLDVEPKEVSIVLILGPIRLDDLGKLGGIGGLGALGDMQKDKAKDKDKPKDGKGDTE